MHSKLRHLQSTARASASLKAGAAAGIKAAARVEAKLEATARAVTGISSRVDVVPPPGWRWVLVAKGDYYGHELVGTDGAKLLKEWIANGRTDVPLLSYRYNAQMRRAVRTEAEWRAMHHHSRFLMVQGRVYKPMALINRIPYALDDPFGEPELEVLSGAPDSGLMSSADAGPRWSAFCPLLDPIHSRPARPHGTVSKSGAGSSGKSTLRRTDDTGVRLHLEHIAGKIKHLHVDMHSGKEIPTTCTGRLSRLLFWRLPMEMKISSGRGSGLSKWALRQILHKYVPPELIDRPKAGFGIPIGQWLRGPLREWAEDLLDFRVIGYQGYLHPEPIQMLWQQHLSGRFDHTNKLWTVLMWQAWLKEWA